DRGRRAFCRAADEQLAFLSRVSRRPVAMGLALVPAERFYWLGVLQAPWRLRQQRCALRISCHLMTLHDRMIDRTIDPDVLRRLSRKVDAIARRPHSGRQAQFNAACFHSRCYEALQPTCGAEFRRTDPARAEQADAEYQRAYACLRESTYE